MAGFLRGKILWYTLWRKVVQLLVSNGTALMARIGTVFYSLNENEKGAYIMGNNFFVPEEACRSTISVAAHMPEIATFIDNAMIAIESENNSLKNVHPKN